MSKFASKTPETRYCAMSMRWNSIMQFIRHLWYFNVNVRLEAPETRSCVIDMRLNSIMQFIRHLWYINVNVRLEAPETRSCVIRLEWNSTQFIPHLWYFNVKVRIRTPRNQVLRNGVRWNSTYSVHPQSLVFQRQRTLAIFLIFASALNLESWFFRSPGNQATRTRLRWNSIQFICTEVHLRSTKQTLVGKRFKMQAMQYLPDAGMHL